MFRQQGNILHFQYTLPNLRFISMIQGGAIERMFLNLPAISFFGVTSNQKSTFENLVQSTIGKFPFAKKLQLCHKKC